MKDELQFQPEEAPAARPPRGAWTVLIVDDDPEVHSVTRLALAGFTFADRTLRFLHAQTAAEAQRLLAQHGDIALVLLDVVMETDHAGLELVEHIRGALNNRFIRIVLRTGQPGQAPELQVITRYDINDYKYKTELTRERLYTTVYTGLSTYRDLIALEANRRGLEKVIDASAHIFELRSLEGFAQGVLEQLAALLFLDCDALMVRVARGGGGGGADAQLQVIAGTGAYRDHVGHDAAQGLPAAVLARIRGALAHEGWSAGETDFVGHHAGAHGVEVVFFLEAGRALPAPDRRLLELFCRNVTIARENLRVLHDVIGHST